MSNQTDLRSLLEAAFSSDELYTLAHDLFPDLYKNLDAFGHTRRAQEIATYAVRQGRTTELLSYVREKNIYQYRQYLIRQGEQALQQKDYEQAISLFQEAGNQERAAHAQFQKKEGAIEALGRAAVGFEKDGKWTKAAEIYRQLVAEDPGEPRWIEAADRIEKEQMLMELYDEALTHIQNKDWPKAEESLVRIIGIRATYRDAAQLLTQVVSRRHPRRVSAIAIGAAVLALALIAGIGFLISRLSASTTAINSTAAPASASITIGTIPTLTEPPGTPVVAPSAIPTIPTTDRLAILSSLDHPDDVITFFRENGVRIGVRSDAPPWGEGTGTSQKGFDIDLANDFVIRWGIPAEKVELIPLAAGDRITAVTSGRVDFVIATLSYSEKRCTDINCSLPYAQDGVRILTPEASDIRDFCDLDGKTTTVYSGTLVAEMGVGASDTGSEAVLVENGTQIPALTIDGMACSSGTAPTISRFVFSGRDEAISAVRNRPDLFAGYITDGAILESYAERNEGWKVVGKELFAEKKHIGTPKSAQGLASLVNYTLQSMAQDGWHAYFYNNHFGCDSGPFSIDITNPLEQLPDYTKKPNSPLPELIHQCDPTGLYPKEYLMEPGDSLRSIALAEYGNESLYRCIQKESGIEDAALRRLSLKTRLRLLSKEECLMKYPEFNGGA